jgi:hypothetical protein
MKDFLLHPINFFRKEIQVNNAIEEALFQNDEVSNAKISFVYFSRLQILCFYLCILLFIWRLYLLL